MTQGGVENKAKEAKRCENSRYGEYPRRLREELIFATKSRDMRLCSRAGRATRTSLLGLVRVSMNT